MRQTLFKISLILIAILNFSGTYYPSEAGKTVDQLLDEIEIALSGKYHMNPIGMGASMPGGIVKKLILSFQLEGPLSKEELRKILIHATQDFVDHVNKNNRIIKYLEHAPFKIQNTEIDLFIIYPNGYEVEHPHIGTAGIRNGKIEYLTFTIVNNIPKDVTEEWETYEEAVKILQEQTANKSNSPM
jgi:hypothetical protein